MKNFKDLLSNIILLTIIAAISILIFYIFFYSGSRNMTSPKEDKTEKDIFSSIDTSTMTQTRYKGKSVYITDSRAKIRSEPKFGATVLAEKGKGEKLIVEGAQGDWFEVTFDSQRKGWILREHVSERKPSLKTEETIISPEVQEKNQALDLLRADIDNLAVFLNQLSSQRFLKDILTGFEVLEGGLKLIVYVTDTWYNLPFTQKQMMINFIAMKYSTQCCVYKIRTECSSNDFPTISLLNSKNKEIARMAANQPLQIYE